MNDPTKYYDSDREDDQRFNKTGRYKTPRRGLMPGEATRWSVAKMWDIHHEAKRLMLLGWKNVDIATKLGITAVAVSAYRNSPAVQEELAIMRAARDADTIDIAKEIRDFAPEALDLLKDVIRGDNEMQGASLALRTKTSESMLDRAGHSAIQKFQGAVAHLTADEIEAMKTKANLNSAGLKVPESVIDV